MAKYKKDKKDKKPFTLRFRSKKAPTQSLSVLKKKWNRGERPFYSSIFSPSKMAAASAEPLPTILARDSRFLRTLLGRYFLIVPNDGEEKRKSATRGDFNVLEVGRCAVVRVSKLLAALRNHKKRQNLRKAYLRLGERINHLVEDMHKKTATICLNRKSKACMAALAHCACFDRTAMKAEQFEQKQVVEVKEEWTSKTCSCCG
ncbi:hypothetical protein V1506DRAFT_553188 [Lipomyces tetrasporus]